MSDRPHSATADEATARNTIANVDSTGPIRDAFGQAEADIGNQYFEDDLPEGVESQIRAGRLFNLQQKKGAALSEAVSRDQQQKAGNQLSLAGMTQNTTYQSGGTSYGEQWGGIGQTFANSLASSLGQA